MAQGPSEKIKKAEELYRKGITMVKIAKQLGVSDSTVRSWKNRYKWDGEKSATLQKKKCNVAKRKTSKKRRENDLATEEVASVIQNEDLTEKQRLFCIYYIRCFNATRAYQKAYGCKYDTANAEGYKLLVNPCVREEILRLKQNRLNREFFSEEDLFQKYMDIAFADITDFVKFGRKKVKVTLKTGGQKTISVNYVDLKDSAEADGTIITEVSEGKDGVKVKIADRMKAMQWLSEHMDLASTEQKALIEKLKAETEQIKSSSDENEYSEIDDWISGVTGETLKGNDQEE